MFIRHFAAALFTAASLSSAVIAASAAQSRQPDLLVIGGTPAGVAAAVAAARHGERVELIARRDILGGTLTDAMMDQWDLNLGTDGGSIQHGIFDEIHRDLGDAFGPARAAQSFAEMVRAEPRIDVRYGELPIAAATVPDSDGMRVDAVTFRNVHTGATTVACAPLVIDATDFGDVAALAGAKYDVGRQDTGRDTRMQAVTLMFTVQDVDWARVANGYDLARFGPGGGSARRAWGYAELMRAYTPLDSRVLVRDLNFGYLGQGAVSVNAIDVVGIDGRDAEQLALARRLTTLEANRLVDFLRMRLPGFARARLGGFAPDVYVRETRHFQGLARLTAGDVWSGRVPADSIGLSSYPLDLHPVDVRERPAYAPYRHVYGVPFGALVPRGLTNLALASPAISASHLAAGSARVIPTTIEEGEAAGVAAALATREAIGFATLARSSERIAALRAELAASGAIVGTPSASGSVLATVAKAAPRERTEGRKR